MHNDAFSNSVTLLRYVFLDGRCIVSRIGTVEKINIASVLQRVETFTKTGLLVIKQDTQWVEFYCREGHLLCVGPIRTDATLGERLLHDGVISSQALQETMFSIGSAVPSETRIALTLMDLGYVTREDLRAWATEKTETVLAAVLSWSTGELHFDEDADPPSERLLVSLSISTLLAALSSIHATPQAISAVQQVAQERTLVAEEAHAGAAVWDASQSATLYDSTQFLAEPSTSPSYISAGALLPSFTTAINPGSAMPSPPPQTPPPMPSVSMTALSSTRMIDTSFMQADMVLVPADLSALPEQHIQVTPDQWRLLTRVDGLTSLQDACFALNMHAKDVCRVAGELIAERLVQVVPPSIHEIQEMSPASQNLLQSGLSNGLAVPGYAATMQSPWGNVLPVSDMLPQSSSPLATRSQWGNGGNGTTFVPGQGWVTPMQPLQPMQPNSFSNSGAYMSVGSNR